MDLQIALLLGQDGIVNGAIYALLALTLVLVFSVTRVIFVPQGELVAFGALTLATMQLGKTPPTVYLAVALGVLAVAAEAWRASRGQLVEWGGTLTWCVALPLAALAWTLLAKPTGLAGQVALTLLICTPLGPLLYRLAYRPLAHATVLMLLIVSVALHGALMGLGLWFFGAEGSRTPAFWDARFELGGLPFTGQTVVVIAVAAVLMLAMFAFFEKSIVGKALRATAINRTGARLMGIPTEMAGDLSFALAALIGAISGLLIAPITTIYYDTGFLIGLKGFVAAIIGALASYPLAVAGAILVGLLEAFSSFWASAYKEVIVFTLIIPVLWWRSLRTHHVEEDE
jgi:branched-chain amino acid transport system permease protein